MTFISTLGQSQDQIIRLKNLQLQLGTLQTQVATGKKTQSFKGLGTDVMISKRARADFQKLDIYVQNIDRASIRIKQMLAGIEGIQQQVNTAIDSVVNQTQDGDVELDFIRTLAENSFDFIVDTLNLKDGDAYIYSGSDSSTQPIIDSGSLDSFFRRSECGMVLWIADRHAAQYDDFGGIYLPLSQHPRCYAGFFRIAGQCQESFRPG